MIPFQAAVKFVLQKEGGYVNSPNDPGGETNMGISKKQYPEEDIKNLTLARAIELYKSDYWDANSLDDMDFPLCICAFDAYVQHKPTTVQTLLDASNGDWVTFIAKRISYYMLLINKNPALRVFQRGWVNRMVDLKKYIEILLQDENPDSV